MGLATTAILAATAFSAGSQIISGNKQSKNLKYQGQYDAQVYEMQAGMIQEQKKIEEYQYNRAGAKLRGGIVARSAGNGLLLSGSPLALLVDSESQLQMDKAIGQYNLEVQSRYASSGANYYRYSGDQQAKLARATGYSNAFSSILQGATNLAIMRAGKL